MRNTGTQKKTTKGRRWLAGVLAAALALGLAACGGPGEGTAAGSSEAGSTEAGSTAAGSSEAGSAAASGEGAKEMRFGSTGYFAAETLDPANGWDGWYMTFDGALETLFKLDENMEPEPALALSCESSDYITWTLKLREDVTFQSGAPMTGEAVKACLERTYETSVRAQEQIALASIEAEGQTLTIRLQGENVTLMSDLTDPLWSVYDTENSDYATAVYGTGPYRITEFEPFVETVVVKYEGYWGGEPKLDSARLITISDTEALSMALQNGEIDMAVAMPTSAISLFENNPAFVVDAVTTSRGSRMYYNMQRPAMQDPAVRQAIAMCLDREGIAQSIYHGMATPSYGIFPDFLSYGGTEGLVLTVDGYDPEGAAQVLAEAGWADTNGNGILDKDGVELSLRAITFASRKELSQVLELLQAELLGIGIDLKVDVMENTADVQNSGDFDLDCETGVMVPTGNAQYFFNMMAVTGGSSNYSYYSNPELDSLAGTLAVTADEGERDSLIRQMVQMLLDDNALTVFNHQKMVNIYSSAVSGYATHPSEYYLLDVHTDIQR